MLSLKSTLRTHHSFMAVNLKHFNGNVSDLQKTLSKASGLSVLDFYADWCGPCKQLGSILPTIAQKYPKVNFLKANVDSNEELSRHFNIEAVPQIKFFKNVPESGDFQESATVVGMNIAGIMKTIDRLQ